MMRRFVVVCVVAATALTASGQQPTTAQNWLQGPEQWLLTPQERSELARISSPGELERFTELFWARRDPNLDTRVNEFKMDFEARVVAADKQFGEEGVRGALTDRGKVLILLGKPAKRWTEAIQNFLARLKGETPGRISTSAQEAESMMHGATYDPYKGKADVWVYSRAQLPPTAKLPKRVDSVMFVFFDYEGKNHWVLDRRFSPSRYAIKALEVAAEALVAHPELEEPPVYPLLPGTTAATAEQLAWFGLDPQPWPDGAAAALGPGVTTERIIPTWVFVRLPKATVADLAVGRFTTRDGKVLGTFQKQVTGLDTADGFVYEFSLPPMEAPGTFELALASGSTPVAVRKFSVVPPELSADGTWMTPMYAGAQVLEQHQFEAGTPFIFGGYHLVLRPEGNYTRKETLNYFCLVVRPGTGEDGNPKGKLRLAIYQDGKRLTGTPYREVEFSPVEPNVYMFGSALPLNVFRAGGSFTLKVWLKDEISGTERTTELPLELQ